MVIMPRDSSDPRSIEMVGLGLDPLPFVINFSGSQCGVSAECIAPVILKEHEGAWK